MPFQDQRTMLIDPGTALLACNSGLACNSRLRSNFVDVGRDADVG